MSVPGIGVVSVLAYVSTTEDPARFARSRTASAAQVSRSIGRSTNKAGRRSETIGIHPDGSADVRVARRGEGAGQLQGRPLGPLWTLQRLCFGPNVAAAHADRGENHHSGPATTTAASKGQLTEKAQLENAPGGIDVPKCGS